MAEAVLSGVATAILESLASEMAKPVGSSASQKILLLCGAKDELKRLEKTVQSIQAVLSDAEKQQWHNDQVKLWLGRLKDVLYDVEDLFDAVKTEEMRRKLTSGNKFWEGVCAFFSESNPLLHPFIVANKIQELRKKLDGIKNDREGFRLETHLSGPSVAIVGRRTTHSFVREEEIIGREEDKKEIIAHLLDSSSRETVSVVSILGIGGLGKTTLARLVYNDDRVNDCFKPKLWACHGDAENFDEYVIIKEILKSAQHECRGDPELMRDLQDIEKKSKEQLQQLLRKVLDGKQYLLVLDDLWNEDHQAWLDLRSLLPWGSSSKILVTTRNRSVVRATNAKSVVHDLRGLSEDESWDLFEKIALVDREEPLNPRLEEIGRDIVRKCAGVPLAIRTIGSLLYNAEEKKWLQLWADELSKIDTSARGVMEALKVSYDHLPSSLKHCFAYCALFPKDYVFDKGTMIQLWMAQGFIESLQKNEDLEEAGDRCVSYLLQRSFLEVEKLDEFTSEVKMFKMHDLMHDLASKVAGDECKMINLNESSIRTGGTRHVSFASQSSLLQEWTSRLEATNLRTFLALQNRGTGEQDLSPNEWKGIFSKIRHCRTLALPYADFCIPRSLGSRLKHLRFLSISGNMSIESLPDSITDLVNLETLDLSYCHNLTTLPSDLGKLVNLRFLDVSENNSIESLPDSITDLVNLRTLKLSYCQSIEALPRNLKKLINLRHLLIDGCSSLSHMPCGLNHLSSLQTLSNFVVQKMDQRVPGAAGRVDELGGLNKLTGSIRLEQLEFLQPTPNKGHLREKEHLRSLDLEWWFGPLEERDEKSESDELIVWENLRPHQNLTHLRIYNFMGRNPPSWLSSIRCLVELMLSSCRRLKYLPPLSELPCLRELHLAYMDELEFVEEIRDPQQSNTARPFFPSLERLWFRYCGKLKGWWGRTLPVGEEQDQVRYDSRSSFPKLSNVKIWDCHDLKSWPLLPSVVDLEFCRSSVKVLEQQVMAVPEAALVSTSIPLSKLKKLEFVSIWDLEQSMLETLLPFLRNLESMTFFDCSALRSLSSGMQYLSLLQHLKIDSCEELDLSSHDDEHGTQWQSLDSCEESSHDDEHGTQWQSLDSCEELDLSSHDDEHGTQWQSLANLRALEIKGLPQLMTLPEEMQHVTALQSLSITKCENLTRLPEWIGNFCLLRDLHISYCPGIECLPDGMLNLTSLKRFRIDECPALQMWCQREDGADWEKIKCLARLHFRLVERVKTNQGHTCPLPIGGREKENDRLTDFLSLSLSSPSMERGHVSPGTLLAEQLKYDRGASKIFPKRSSPNSPVQW